MKKSTSDYRKERQKRGLCHDCSSPVMPGKRLCPKHFRKYKKFHKQRYIDAVSRGLCPQCGERAPIRGLVQCSYCRMRAVRRNKKRLFHYRAVKFNWTYKTHHTAKDFARIWKRQRGLCALTGLKLTVYNAEVDHILPKAKGGLHNLENLRWTIKTVNRIKRDLLDEEFLFICRAVVSRINQ